MNYLQLVQTMHRLVRADNAKLGAAPTSVVGQDGILDELAFFIAQANLDIQNESNNWRFMWREQTLTLPAGQDTVNPSAIPDFGDYILAEIDGAGRYITMWRVSRADEITVRFVPFPSWQQSYLERGQRGPGQPGNFTILPDNRMRFDMVADDAYTIRVNYKRSRQSLSQNTDIPIIPEQHRMAIVWWAINRYFCTTRTGADKLRQLSEREMRREMRSLYSRQEEDAILHEALR